MPSTETSIEFCPAGGDPDDSDTYIEVRVELEYEFEPSEPMIPYGEMAGPGCGPSADLIEDSIKRTDGEPVCAALLAAVLDWWKRHGQGEAVERGEEAEAIRKASRRGRNFNPDDL